MRSAAVLPDPGRDLLLDDHVLPDKGRDFLRSSFCFRRDADVTCGVSSRVVTRRDDVGLGGGAHELVEFDCGADGARFCG